MQEKDLTKKVEEQPDTYSVDDPGQAYMRAHAMWLPRFQDMMSNMATVTVAKTGQFGATNTSQAVGND